jgi:hypothetical protein
MAKNTGKNHREGEVRERSQVRNPRTGDFVKRDANTGEVSGFNRDGTPFKGVRRGYSELERTTPEKSIRVGT